MYRRPKWNLQLSTVMCISTSSWDVNPTSFSQLTRRVGISLQSLSNHKCGSVWGSLYFITHTWRHTCRYKCAKLQWRGPVKGIWGYVCCSDCVTEQTGESANVSLLQKLALPTPPPCQSHWKGIGLVTGRSHTQAERQAPICSHTHSIRDIRATYKFQ